MVNFYIANNENMEILFCNPINEEAHNMDSINIEMLLSFYGKSLQTDNFGQIRSIKFHNSKIVFEQKYNFLFIFCTGSDYNDELMISQLFFFKNMFLQVFAIKTKENARELTEEISKSQKQIVPDSFERLLALSDILDLHLADIDKRNIVEIFYNIFNALWAGVKNHLSIGNKSGKNEVVKNWVEEINNHIIIAFTTIENHFCFTEKGFTLVESSLEKENLLKIKRELIQLLKYMTAYVESELGGESIRSITNYQLSNVIFEEWQRMESLGLTKDITKTLWR